MSCSCDSCLVSLGEPLLTDEDVRPCQGSVNSCIFIDVPEAPQTGGFHCLFTAKTLN